jgi:poly(A) polymerase
MSIPASHKNSSVETILERLRAATRNSAYENRLYLVGGLLRDRALGLPIPNDLDLVLEGDAVELATFLYAQGLSEHYPVLYPRFGTAMIHVAADGVSGLVELVSARAESYQSDSRKPDVRQGTLKDDAFRRDFTINTLMENLHTGERLDLTGRAWQDLRDGVIRTPLAPQLTFFDDPLRMLRAARFAARLDFSIEAATWAAMVAEAERLRPPAISYERIQEEFVKIVQLPGPKARRGLELLRESRLLEQFLPEMLPMIGCTQGGWHPFDVWTHTLVAMEQLPDDARLETRLGLLWHDVAKPATRMEDERGIHFYGHPVVGAEMARTMMRRLKFSNEEIRDVAALVEKHMRLGAYKPQWTDAPVKRLIRDCGDYLDDLFTICRCDLLAMNVPPEEAVDLTGLRARIDALNALSNVAKIESPLDGKEIMALLEVGPGPHLRAAKEFLTDAVIEGRLAEGDKANAERLLRDWWAKIRRE